MNNKSFSVIIIPDLQTVIKKHPHLLEPMARWIADQSHKLNVKVILQLGDIVESRANQEEFKLASDTMNVFSEANIPFIICPGNHDYDNHLREDRNLTVFNQYFGPHLYENKSWFGGLYEAGSAENMFFKIEAEGRKLLVLALEFGPRDEVLEWADQVLELHREYEAIVITHCYMYIRGERTKSGDDLNPKSYPGAFGANDGEDVWQKSLRKHANVIAVFSGHHVPRNVSYRVDTGDCGNPVFQSFQNWQFAELGGEGKFRIMKFPVDGDGIELSVMNPQTGTYEEAPGYFIQLPLP